MELINVQYYQVYKKWQGLSGIFDCYVHSTSFATLKEYPNFNLHMVSDQRDSRIDRIVDFTRKAASPQTIFFIDLPLSEALNCARYLNRDLAIRPVLTARNIQHPFGIIGEDNISALIGYSEIINACDSSEYAFVLDSRRYADYPDDMYKTHFDNQYELTEYDLPPVEMLREYGYSRIAFVYETVIKEDLENYKKYLTDNNMDIYCFDIAASEETAANG